MDTSKRRASGRRTAAFLMALFVALPVAPRAEEEVISELVGKDAPAFESVVDDGGAVVGCVLVAFPENGAKIRQIAVDGPYRGRGIGSELLRRADQAVRGKGIRMVMIHARVSARGYFE